MIVSSCSFAFQNVVNRAPDTILCHRSTVSNRGACGSMKTTHPKLRKRTACPSSRGRALIEVNSSKVESTKVGQGNGDDEEQNEGNKEEDNSWDVKSTRHDERALYFLRVGSDVFNGRIREFWRSFV